MARAEATAVKLLQEVEYNMAIPETPYFLSQEAFADIERKIKESSDASADLKQGLASIPSLSGKVADEKNLINYLTKGISPKQAESMLVNDIVKNENSVKKVLNSLNVKKIPQNVFDGLVSMQNQLNDISYAFIAGQKIDLTPLYKKGEWDRAASLIAADERDRPRRIREAALIVGNDYGPTVPDQMIINQGLNNTNELITKQKLNIQTGEPATSQQILAAATNYLKQTGKTLPKQVFPLRTIIKDSEFEQLSSRATGPWPY